MKVHDNFEIGPEYGEYDDITLNDFSFDVDMEDDDLNAGDDFDLTTLLD